MVATKYTYEIATNFPNGKIDSPRLTQEIQQSSIVTALDRIDTADGYCDVWFKAALSAGDETTLDGDASPASTGSLIGDHSGEPLPSIVETSDGVPIVHIEGPSDPQDKKPIIVMSPATEGWGTWITGAADDDGYQTRGDGEQFRLDFVSAEIPATKTVDYPFIENIEIHDGQVSWEPVANWNSDDTFSLGVHIDSTVATVNGTNEGNCNLVDSGQGYNVIVPAAGDGTHDVVLADVCPVPAQGAGYWDAHYETGAVTASATPGAANFHLLDVPITSWLIKNIATTHPGGWFDIDVYKTEWFHKNWKLRWEVTKNTAGDGTITGWILSFRQNTQ